MKTLKDIRHLLNDDAIDFVDMWIAKHWDAEVVFYKDDGNWLTVCMPYEDIYKSKQNTWACVSLSKIDSGGAKSAFYGCIKHFVKMAAAHIGKRRTNFYTENMWVNYEWCQRVRKWLLYRYGITY